MSACDDVRPLLGELLLGALDAPDEALDHVADCADCARELAALHELELTLALPARPTPWVAWGLVLACAAGAGLLLGSLVGGGTPRAPRPQVLEGSARQLRSRALPGDALPAGRIVAGDEGLTLRLPDGSVLRALPGAALSLESTRALRLYRGHARLSVVRDPARPFRVETPRAPVRVVGTVFDVHVEEVVVAGTGVKAAGLAAVVGVSVLSGAVLFGEGADALEVESGQAAVADVSGVRRVAVGAQAVAQAQAAQHEAEAALDAQRARADALEAEAATLRARVEALEAAQTDPAAPPEDPAPPPTPTSHAFTFGDTSPERAHLQEIEWEAPAEAVRTMLPLLTEYAQTLLAGEKPSDELQVAVYKQNAKLIEPYLEVRGKLPTHADGNGEYAHPAFLASLLDAYLRAAGRPLDEAQRARVEALGRDYDAAWAQAQLGYREDTLRVEKLLDELKLKAAFRANLDGVLDGQQRALLGDESLKDVSGMDLFSPVLVFSATSRVLPGADAPALRAQLQGTLASLGIDGQTPGVDAVLDAWLAAALDPTPVPEHAVWAYTLQDGLRSLAAEAAAFRRLTQLPLAPEQLAALRAAGWTVIPRLMAQ
ncbi:MAG: FecR family protein [Planctomycetota bacterium]